MASIQLRRQTESGETALDRSRPIHHDTDRASLAPAVHGISPSPAGVIPVSGMRTLQRSVGNAAAQRLLAKRKVGAAATTKGSPTESAASDHGKARADALKAYEAWLEERLGEVAALAGQAKVARVRGLLSQVESVSVALIGGTLPDLHMLSKTPVYQDEGVRGYVPPELVDTVRQLIDLVERPIESATAEAEVQPEGSLYDASTDWNARLGVPQYRTQSDNLAAPEATCNVTSFAMIAERLGYSRADLLMAIDKELHVAFLQTPDGKAAARDEQPEDVAVPDTFWQARAKAYLIKVNSDSKAYRRLRGGRLITVNEALVKAKKGAKAKANERSRQVDQQMTALAVDFKTSAQTEDLLDFFLHLQGISRTKINLGNNPQTVIDKLNPDDSTQNKVEKLTTWSDITRTKLKKCLEAGGAAIYSFYHKGAGGDGTHIITVQSVTDGGFIVDDPFGRINPDYRRDQQQDAYAPTGLSGASSRTSRFKNKVNKGDKSDWTIDSAQNATSGETLGKSYELSNDIVKSAFYYIVLFHRAKAVKK